MVKTSTDGAMIWLAYASLISLSIGPDLLYAFPPPTLIASIDVSIAASLAAILAAIISTTASASPLTALSAA